MVLAQDVIFRKRHERARLSLLSLLETYGLGDRHDVRNLTEEERVRLAREILNETLHY